MADLKNQVDNLKLLVSSVESDLAARDESRMVAGTTEAYLVALRKNLAEVEQDTEEAFESRRELATLLVENIVVGCNEEGQTKVDVTYRFGPPKVAVGEDSAHGVQNSEAHAREKDGSHAPKRGGGAFPALWAEEVLGGPPALSDMPPHGRGRLRHLRRLLTRRAGRSW
jgi:hypothetical protein